MLMEVMLVEPRSGLGFAWSPATPTARWTQLGLLATGAAWLVYTKLYFFLHPRGLTVAPSLFMYVTGRPDPFCGLTRTFAWMWHGNLAAAVRVYPLGPIVFAGTWVALGVLAYSAAKGRSLRVALSPERRRALLTAAAVALAVNWTLKLLWLGM
jgi:Protein of unknown function (DUF2752)